MELVFTGEEVHFLRVTLEADLMNLEKEIDRTGGLKAREELKDKEKFFRSILEKIPAEFETV
jgi:hypothetical protein